MHEASLESLFERGLISDFDVHFARFLGTLDGRSDRYVVLAAALASFYRSNGHTCIDLSDIGNSCIEVEGFDPLTFPSTESLLRSLIQSQVVGKPGDYRPLILNGTLLYLYRYWNYERKLASSLTKKALSHCTDYEEERIYESIERLFPREEEAKDGDVNWQKLAAFACLRKKLCVISGGPGTGKTFAIARILAFLLECLTNERLQISLATPTGKAAVRLQEALKEAKKVLPCHELVLSRIPTEASTIHRLLKSRPFSPYFDYNEHNPLSSDIVVIDEASMVDLALFSKLAQSLKENTRLIALGDRDQLASVEAGSVLGDICHADHLQLFTTRFIEHYRRVTGEHLNGIPSGSSANELSDCIVRLNKNYRFKEESGLYRMSDALRRGDIAQVMSVLKSESCNDIQWQSLPLPGELFSLLRSWILEHYGVDANKCDPLEVLEHFNRARILCALREGPYGVVHLNTLVEFILRREGFIEGKGVFYSGRPILITRNDYTLGLYNGDVGIIMKEAKKSGLLQAFFPHPDGTVKSFSPHLLPDHETVYAMTVHKSQGSEFEDVLFLMPDRDSPLLTRELIYTALTRARNRICILGREDIFINAIKRRILRSSGLRDALWGKS